MDLKDCHHLASASPPLSQSTAVPPAYWKLLCPGHDMAGPFSNVISERPSPILPIPFSTYFLSHNVLLSSWHLSTYKTSCLFPNFSISPFRSWVSCGQRPSLSVLLSGACQGPIPPPDTWWVSCHLSCSGRVTEAAFRDTDFPCVLLPFPDNITDEGYLQICCFAQGSEWAPGQQNRMLQVLPERTPGSWKDWGIKSFGRETVIANLTRWIFLPLGRKKKKNF